ncbi:MAG: hypothetical protein MHPSP_004425, partial [Paramarteilia canceri]
MAVPAFFSNVGVVTKVIFIMSIICWLSVNFQWSGIRTILSYERGYYSNRNDGTVVSATKKILLIVVHAVFKSFFIPAKGYSLLFALYWLYTIINGLEN